MLDTSTFENFLRSLNIQEPVTTQAGAMISGPPKPLAEAAIRAGLGFVFLSTEQTKNILVNLGLDPELTKVVARRMKSLSMWRPVWEDLAAPHFKAMEAAWMRGDRGAAIESIRLILTMLNLAYSGDGYYIYTPLPERRRILPIQRRLYARLRELNHDRVETLAVPHADGVTTGLLHLPKHASEGRWPALLVIHTLAGDKDDYDVTVELFRAAGYATFCIDMPAHGENFDGRRVLPHDEQVCVAALEVLAAHPAIDAERLGVLGGSLGGFFALRTAAASPRVKACVEYASPFDIGSGIMKAVYGIRTSFAWVVGAQTPEEIQTIGNAFALYDALHKITCPVLVVHGTQDHICDFTACYEIARRITSPLTVVPLIGTDHEAAQPFAPHLAKPGVEWLKRHL
ncbi:MAG: alpha/beta fold hydrolase [Anaerolineales bacterium]|nr:alpha/beta fold hydrolase [Anaerolineales bacterium]